MPANDDQTIDTTLDGSLVAVPISEEESRANIKVCAIARRTPDPASGHFILLEGFSDGRVLLGCLCDASARVVEWLELWVQDFGNADSSFLPTPEKNAVRDERWTRLAVSLLQVDPESYLTLRAAAIPPRPVFVDLEAFAPRHPELDKLPIEVCLDDRRLTASGLSVYGLDHRRFGWVPQHGEQGRLVALTAAAADFPGSASLAECLPPAPTRLAPLNPAGGHMLARRFAPLGLMEFASILGGRSWSGVANARRPFKLGGIYQSLEDASTMRCGGRHFFASREGQAGRAVEVLHLKLLLIEQCVRLVRDEIHRSQLPMLNLAAESFRVRLGTTGRNLPYCWTARVVLSRFGQAVALPVPNSRNRYFKARETLGGSIYRPEGLAIPKKGQGGFRITRVLPPVEDGTVIEATLVTQQRVELNELLEVSIPLIDGQITLFGTIDPSLARAKGEYYFRSIPLQLPAERVAALNAVAGVVYAQVPFNVLPPLNSPCDLFALGVLALEILFAGCEITLPVALDACLSLARELAARADAKPTLAESIRTIFKQDPRYVEILGSQHLCQHSQEISASQAESLIPRDLWFGLFAIIVRFFPGRGPFSYCGDFGDAAALAVQSVFEQPLLDLEALCAHTRSLHVMDWVQNLELAEAIKGFAP